MNYNYHLLFKFIVVGDFSNLFPNSGVGKSAILLRFIDEKFNDNYQSTLGVQFGSKTFSVGNTTIKTMIWDTAGQQSFKSIIRSYYKNAIVAILVFDLTNPQSFQNIQKWMEEVKTNANEHTRLVLVGNKADLFEKRAVRKDVAEQYAQKMGMPYYQTSAKNGNGVSEVFTKSSKQLIEDIQEKKLIVNANTESIGVKIGNVSMPAKQKTAIQISVSPEQRKKCNC